MSISLGDNHLDSREIDDRIDELEEIRIKWLAGWNMPGYMPDNEPAGFADWESARDYISNAMLEAGSNIATDGPGDEYDDENPEKLALEAAASELDDLDDESEYGQTVGAYHYWIVPANEGDQFEDEDDAKEFKAWTELKDECEGYGWRHGIHFIADSAFEDYAEEFAADIGAIDRNASWPLGCIDWKQAAKELQADYTSTEIDGETYWYREA